MSLLASVIRQNFKISQVVQIINCLSNEPSFDYALQNKITNEHMFCTTMQIKI